MYNLLIAGGIALAVFAVIALALGQIPAIFPALIAFGIAAFLLARRTGAQVTEALAPIPSLLQQRKVDAVKALLIDVKERYGRWQVLLAGQLDAQLGMLEYLQMHWDEARPLLERGRWRDWTAHVCLGAIHHRQGRLDEAWSNFQSAESIGPKEVMVYLVHATLLARSGEREKALEVLARGTEKLPENAHIKELKRTLANKARIDTTRFPETWYQFFPEEVVQQMSVRGRRGDPQVPGQPNVVQRPIAPPPRMRGKLARRR